MWAADGVDHATGAARWGERADASVQICGMHGRASRWPLPRVSTTSALRPEEGKSPGGGTRGALHGRVPDHCPSSRAGALRPLRGARRGAAQLAVAAAGAAGAGSAADCGAHHRPSRPSCRSSTYRCHRWEDQLVEFLKMDDTVTPRAAYCSAQDLLLTPSSSRGSQRTADGGAVGGSANGCVFHLAVRRAER